MATNAYETAPGQLSGVIPYLSIDGAGKAADFYAQAFGALRVGSMEPDEKGRFLHIHLSINGGPVMLSDFFPEYGHPPVTAQGFMLHLQVENCDAAYAKAIAAGGAEVTAPHDAFWGDRYAQLKDPFGVTWTIASANK